MSVDIKSIQVYNYFSSNTPDNVIYWYNSANEKRGLIVEYKSCAVTGHRPTRFKWKYNENNNGCRRLKRRLKEQLVLFYENGVRRFYTGGALGVDLWAGELLMELKEQPEYGEIELILVLPFDGHDKDWDPKSATGYLFCVSTARRLSSPEVKKILP